MINDLIKTSYDKVPYQSNAFINASIDRMYVVAKSYGINATKPENARVLELGCAAGGNIIAQAIKHKSANFIGVDLATSQIQEGQKAINKLGLKNIELFSDDLANIARGGGVAKYGKFDYIIAHGIFSWVPDFVKKAIYEIGAKLLSDNGVQMISYNTYPGWKFKEITRDFMRFASKDIDFDKEPAQKLQCALNALKFEIGAYKTTTLSSPAHDYQILTRELKAHNNKKVQDNKNPSYIMHEYLEIYNCPSYLIDFVADANDLGLAYVEDMHLHFDYNEFSNAAVEEYAKLAWKNRIEKDQMFDFLNSTQFRHSLLTLKKNESKICLDHAKMQERIMDFHLCLSDKSEYLKERAKGLELEHLVRALYDAYPASISVREAIKLVPQNTLIGHIYDISAVTSSIFISYERLFDIKYEVNKSRLRQDFMPLVRYLANDKTQALCLGGYLNQSLRLNSTDYEIFTMLDGKNSKADIIKYLLKKCRMGNFAPSVQIDGKQMLLGKPSEQEAHFSSVVDNLIKGLELAYMFEKF